jgi:hypothetical protein
MWPKVRTRTATHALAASKIGWCFESISPKDYGILAEIGQRDGEPLEINVLI